MGSFDFPVRLSNLKKVLQKSAFESMVKIDIQMWSKTGQNEYMNSCIAFFCIIFQTWRSLIIVLTCQLTCITFRKTFFWYIYKAQLYKNQSARQCFWLFWILWRKITSARGLTPQFLRPKDCNLSENYLQHHETCFSFSGGHQNRAESAAAFVLISLLKARGNSKRSKSLATWIILQTFVLY